MAGVSTKDIKQRIRSMESTRQITSYCIHDNRVAVRKDYLHIGNSVFQKHCRNISRTDAINNVIDPDTMINVKKYCILILVRFSGQNCQSRRKHCRFAASFFFSYPAIENLANSLPGN